MDDGQLLMAIYSMLYIYIHYTSAMDDGQLLMAIYSMLYIYIYIIQVPWMTDSFLWLSTVCYIYTLYKCHG